MKVAILSDSHDQKENLLQALKLIDTQKITTALFAGDFCAPSVIKHCFGQFPHITMHTVFGNNDGDRYRMATVGADFPNMAHHGEYMSLELDGKRIGMTHYPFYGEAMAKSGDFDLVVFGHDHHARFMTYGDCLAVNPGSILGDRHAPSFALYDTVQHKAVLHTLDGGILTN